MNDRDFQVFLVLLGKVGNNLALAKLISDYKNDESLAKVLKDFITYNDKENA